MDRVSDDDGGEQAEQLDEQNEIGNQQPIPINEAWVGLNPDNIVHRRTRGVRVDYNQLADGNY